MNFKERFREETKEISHLLKNKNLIHRKYQAIHYLYTVKNQSGETLSGLQKKRPVVLKIDALKILSPFEKELQKLKKGDQKIFKFFSKQYQFSNKDKKESVLFYEVKIIENCFVNN